MEPGGRQYINIDSASAGGCGDSLTGKLIINPNDYFKQLPLLYKSRLDAVKEDVVKMMNKMIVMANVVAKIKMEKVQEVIQIELIMIVRILEMVDLVQDHRIQEQG